jgi:hypothetical protein
MDNRPDTSLKYGYWISADEHARLVSELDAAKRRVAKLEAALCKAEVEFFRDVDDKSAAEAMMNVLKEVNVK